MSGQLLWKKNLSLALLLSLFSVNTFANAVIYSETFTGQVGNGVSGPDADGIRLNNFDGVDWSVQLEPDNPNDLDNEFDYVKVVDRGTSNQVLEARDTRGELFVGKGFWSSPVFDITNNPFNKDLLFSMDIWALGIMETAPEDLISIYYSLDGNSEVLISTLHSNIDPNPTHLRALLPSGDQLQIVVEFLSGRGPAERHAIDNILVRVPEPTTLALLAIGLVGIGYKRKKIA